MGSKNLSRGELCELQYEYQRYCMYCVDPVDFESFCERKELAKYDDANEGDDLMGESS